MRIAVFDFVPEGGAKRVVFEHVSYLSQNGHTVLYLSGEEESNFDFEKKVDRINRFDLTEPDAAGLNRWQREWWLLFQLPRVYQRIVSVISNYKAEVVVVHPTRTTQASGLLSMLSIPSLYYMQEPWRIGSEPGLHRLDEVPVFKRWYAKLRRRYIRRVDNVNTLQANRLMTNSKFSSKEIKQYYGRSAEVNYPGVNVDFFTPNNHRLEERSHILFVGNRTELDGFPMVETLEERLRETWPVKVIDMGSGTWVSEEALRESYRQAVVTLCLAKREPFGMVPLESMACGTPVVAVNEGGYRETVLDGETGWLIERSVEALQSAIDRLTQNPQVWERVSRAGRDRTIKMFTWQRHGAQLEQTLMELRGIL